MNRKKILIISSSFYPIIAPRSFRTTELVKEFSRQKHDITLLTKKNDKVHELFEKKYNVTIKDLGNPILPVINLRKGSRLIVILKRVLRRILLQLFEYPNIELMFRIKRALKKEKNYDMLISIATPHPIHWGVAWAWRKKNSVAKIWIADCGDPYMGTTTDSFKKLFYFKFIEKWWCKKANFITVPFQGAIGAYYKEFQNKIRVIPQGFDFDEINIRENEYIKNKIPTFAYTGLFIPGARDPSLFINYLLSLKIDFKFILYNNQKSRYNNLVIKSKGKIEFRDYIERKKLIKILSKMDFLVNFNNGVSTQLPSKLIDYHLTKRPILSLDSFDLDKNTINQFLNGKYHNKFNFEDIEQYKIENVCQKFLKLHN